MKFHVAISRLLVLASALAWVNNPILAGAQTTPNMDTLVRTGSAACARIAAKAKDIDVFGYCIAEMLRPLAQGRSCIAFATASPESGYHCDSKGMLYYEPPTATSSLPMTNEDWGAAFGKVLSKHARKSIATCFLTNENDDGLAACLTKDKRRLKQVFTTCANTKFDVENDALLLRAVDHCIESRLKL
jgi:hypothetical protein